MPIYNDIESRMPGKLIVQGLYAIWSDPLSAENQIHIIDLNEKKEIGTVGNIGNGPEEFITPDFFLSYTDEIVVYDTNNDKMLTYSIDSIREGRKEPISSLPQKTKGFARIIETGEKQFVSFAPNENESFQTENGCVFGKYPFAGQGEILNNYNILQGNIAYNPERKLMVYASIPFPYMASYKKDKDSYTFVREFKGDFDYSISENRIILDKKKAGMMEMTLAKDYVVTLQRDYRYDRTDETKVGRDFNQLPQTLFVYDYDFKLKSIINLKSPILRIASDTRGNAVYAIIVKDDFTLVKCELPPI